MGKNIEQIRAEKNRKTESKACSAKEVGRPTRCCQRAAANALPQEELIQKAKQGRQLNPAESYRFYILHIELKQVHEAKCIEHNSLLRRIEVLQKELRDQQFFTAKLHDAATEHDDQLGAAVASVTWGRSANLLGKLTN